VCNSILNCIGGRILKNVTMSAWKKFCMCAKFKTHGKLES